MIEFIKIEKASLDFLIAEHLKRRPQYKNYFFIDLDNVSYCEMPQTLLLKKQYDLYNRIYFLSNDAHELENCLIQLSDNDIINIPSKKGISSELEVILNKSGYNLFEVYERMLNDEVEPRGPFEAEFAKKKDVDDIYNLLTKTFNPFTDTLPSKIELKELIEKNWILVCRDDKNVVNGALLLRFEPRKCHYYIWVSTSNITESLNLFINGFNLMHERGYKMAYLWVRSTNVRPKKLYQTLGFVHDGLKDYTYTKKNG